jgi:PEP-CTERM motif
MNNLSKLLITALAFGGSISTASAAGDITDVTASGAGLGSFDKGVIGAARTLDFTKSFDSLNPITLSFTVVQGTGPGNPYAVTENITNNTNQAWTDFHFTINEPATGGQGNVFTSHTQSTLTGFTLDSSSGPRNLDFTGNLAAHSTATATFNLSPDASIGPNFTLTQVPTIPEPETYAMLLAGLGLMGAIVRRRNKSNA